MTTPLVSIVIPGFNQAEFLDQAITSVLTQDYPNIELIVLDDGSTDGTRDVLEKYTGRFHWDSHANMGQANTLNKGWTMCKGTYLSYLAADDFLLPGAVSAAVALLNARSDIVLTYCDYNIVDGRSRVLRCKRTPEYNYWDLAVKMVCHPGPAAFFRRDAFERAGLWNPSLRHVPDFEYWLRLGLEGKFQRIPQVLAAYRLHNRSQSFGPVEQRRAEEIVGVLSDYFRGSRVPLEVARAQAQAMSNARLLCARYHLRSGRYATAMKRLMEAKRDDWTAFFRLRTWWLIASGLFNRVGYRVLGLMHNLAGNK